MDWREAKRLYVEEGLSYEEVARRLGYGAVTVSAELRRHGVRTRAPASRTGKWVEPIYGLWCRMRLRCLSKGFRDYPRFGGRGVGITPEWATFRPFYEWARRSGYRKGMSLALVDPDRDFSPENCRLEVSRYRVNRKNPETLVTSRYHEIPDEVRAALSTEQRIKLYMTWKGLLRKCRDPSFHLYRRFGARGIDVCRAWESFGGFLSWVVASGHQPGLALVRRDQRKGFSPANCHWVPRGEVTRKPRIAARVAPPRWPITIYGETKSIGSWARDRRCVVSVNTLRRRLRAHWDPVAALVVPPQNEGPPPTTAIPAFGEVKSLSEWSRDPRCRVGTTGLRSRLARGVAPEEAIATPRFLLGEGTPGAEGAGRGRRGRRA